VSRRPKRSYEGGWRWSLPEHGDRSDERDQASKDGDAPLNTQSDDPLGKPTPLKPSCGAGSAEGDQASEEKEGIDPLGSNPDVARVPGDQNSQGDQGFVCVGEESANHPDGRVCQGVAEGDTRHLLSPAALAEIPADAAGFPRIKVTIVGANALCVNILTQCAWSIAHWGDFARRHYGEFATVICVPAPRDGDAMAEIRGWLQNWVRTPRQSRRSLRLAREILALWRVTCARLAVDRDDAVISTSDAGRSTRSCSNARC
jgi:hypothetical protein